MQRYTQFEFTLLASPAPDRSEFDLAHPELLALLPYEQTQTDRFSFLLLWRDPIRIDELMEKLLLAQWRLPPRQVKIRGYDPDLDNCVALQWNGDSFRPAYL